MRFVMNSSGRLDSFAEAFIKNFLLVTLAIIINFINGLFVYIYFSSREFQRDPRYIFYIHLVINDMIMLTCSVVLYVISYIMPLTFIPCCILVTFTTITTRNTPLNLAGMAVERYITVCHPLHHVQICTVQRAYMFISLMWSMSLIPCLVDIIVVYDTKPFSYFFQSFLCYRTNIYDTLYHQTQRVVLQVLLLSFVSITLIFTYLKVLCAAQAISAANQDSAKNAHNTILLHGAQLFMCLISYFSPLTMYLVAMWPNQRTQILFNSFLFINVYPRLLTPLIYGVRDKKLRSSIRLRFCAKCCNTAGKKLRNMAKLRRRSDHVLH